MVHLSRVELNIARQLYKDELWESRKIKFCDVGEVEEYFLRRRVCHISISGVVVAFCQQREKKSRGQNKPRENLWQTNGYVAWSNDEF